MPTPEPALDALCQRLGHRFARPELLQQALTHSSRANEAGDLALGNERLEFLGDAVLGVVVAELLMAAMPLASEGELTKMRSSAVNQQALAMRGRLLGLNELVRLGRGEMKAGGREKDSILANTFEAIIGAMYLDAGYDATHAFISRELSEELFDPSASERDAKTRLQEMLQAAGSAPLQYFTVAESGPPHAREFSVEARIGDRVLGKGHGRSKQAAEQAAARNALDTPDALDTPASESP